MTGSRGEFVLLAVLSWKGCGKALRRQRRAAPGQEDDDHDDGGLDCCCGSGGSEQPWDYWALVIDGGAGTQDFLCICLFLLTFSVGAASVFGALSLLVLLPFQTVSAPIMFVCTGASMKLPLRCLFLPLCQVILRGCIVLFLPFPFVFARLLLNLLLLFSPLCLWAPQGLFLMWFLTIFL